ncbi:MAG: SDR family oxidoreductase [Deltaproteobacteria bacterium]|nr:SDR family oxidoreductase [Deltaproteobacteria bacterium]
MATKTALITGGASGIGRALAEELAEQGVEVVLADRQSELAEEVADAIRQAGGKATARELDVRDPAQFQRVVDETVARTGRIDSGYTLADWDDVFDVNLRGVAYGVQAVYPVMRAQRSGHIINTASMAGLLPTGEAGSYAASKHAVVGLSKVLRVEAREHGVRVSALCPGVIRTPIMTAGKYGRMNLAPDAEQTMMKLWEQLRPMDPRLFARATLRKVARNAPIIIVPSWWRLFWFVERLSPRLSSWLWAKIYERMQRELAPYRLQ